MLEGARAAHRYDAVNTRVPRAQTPDPRQTGAPAHAADVPGRQGGSQFLAQRLKTPCDPQEAGRQGGTEKPGEPQPQPSPLALAGPGHSPPPQTHTPWGAFSSSPRAYSHPHASTLTRARPRPAFRAPSPFSLPRSCPRGPSEDSPSPNTPCPAPQNWRRRDRGCADAEAAGGRWGSWRASGLLPSGPHLLGSQRLQGQGRRAEGRR